MSGGPPSDNVYIADLPEQIDDDTLRTIFAEYGNIQSCKALPAKSPGQKGAGLVRFATKEEATWVVTNIDGKIPQGLTAPVQARYANPKTGGGKGYGGGYWGPFWPNWLFFKGMGKGKGKGKGKSRGLIDCPPEQKVWIGNLAESVTWKQLQEHMNQAGKTRWVEVFTGKGKGTGGVKYSSKEEVAKAIETLNGSELGGQAIEVDVWEKGTKPAAADAAASLTSQAPALASVLGDYCNFIDELLARLHPLLDVSSMEMDHLCFRCRDSEEYATVCGALVPTFGALLIDAVYAGRPIATVSLHKPILHRGFSVSCIEVASPKPGKEHTLGLEHAEFVVGRPEDGVMGNKRLLEFMAEHADLQFDEKALCKDVNADVCLSFDTELGRISAKFHQRPLYEVVAYELEHGVS